MKIFSDIEQGTAEWHAIRAGVPTASNFGKIVKANGSKSDQAKTYIHQLVGERLLGRTEEGFKSEWMERGNEVEGEARALYEFISGNDVDQVGFIKMDNPLCGCSPDGLIGADGGLEIKCPKLSTHINYALGGKLPSDYHRQVMGSLFVSGRKWWDFMSYYPGLDPFVIRVYPDQAFFGMLRQALVDINNKVDEACNMLINNAEQVTDNDESSQKSDEIPSTNQWSPAAQKIINQVDKMETSSAIDNYRASNRKMIDALGVGEAVEVFKYIENAYQQLIKGEQK